MIINKENLIEYILNSDSHLETLHRETREKLASWNNRYSHPAISIVDNLFLYHQDSNKSLGDLANDIGISISTLARIFDYYNLQKRTQAEAARERWKDEDFRKRQAEAARERLDKRWKDEDFRKRQAEAARERLDKRWKDEDFRKRQAEAVREARLTKIPKIQGYRGDIKIHASTTAEANLARIIRYCRREELTNKLYVLNIPAELNGIFKQKREVRLSLDFLTKDKRGNLRAYQILPRPQEKSYIKADLLKEQYNIRLSIITEEKYQRLERWFKNKINSSKTLAGWEILEDNLKTNPEKYSK